MATTFSFAFAPVKSPNPKLFHHGGSFNLRQCSPKILCMAHPQENNPTGSRQPYAPHTENNEVTRRPAVEFPPSVMNDNFVSSSLSNSKPDTQTNKKIEELKEEVKSTLCSFVTDPSQKLVFIDKIQRLGLAYHFEDEINKTLQHIYDNTAHENGDLNTVGLRFRLLRQAGHFVSPGVFTKFKDEKGEFFGSLRNNLQGLLSLYEAAYMGCKGEHILEEAIVFSTQHLKSLSSQLNLDRTSQVRKSLDLALHKRIPRVEASYYMSVYEKMEGSEKDLLLQLAKLDFNVLQLLHQTELNQLIRWWKESNILPKLPFQARDRVLESYALVMSVMAEPKYSSGRIYSSKLFALFTVIDDIFDVYGTVEELQLITDATSRWDVKDADKLPEFAKMVIVEMYKIFNEIEQDMAMRGVDYAAPYFISETQYYFRCVLNEAKLFHSKRVPTLEEWLDIGVNTIGVRFMIICLVLSHWDLVTKEAMEWSISDPKINYSCIRCARILDDICTFQMEQKRGIIASSVTCYMKEHGVEEKEAIEKLKKMVDDDWKEMNKGCLNPTTIPLRLLNIPVNLIRMGQMLFMYDNDGYTNSGGHVKEMIASLLVNRVPT